MLNIYAVECRFSWYLVEASNFSEAGIMAQKDYGIFNIQKIMVLIEDGKLDIDAVDEIAQTEARRNKPCPKTRSRRRTHIYRSKRRRRH